MNTEEKREHEQQILTLMQQVYCRGNHGSKSGLCKECQELLDYAAFRTQKCPFMETKTFCSACKVHCYAPEKREQIRCVMKYAGPRMMLYHPVLAIKHALITLQIKWKEKANNRK